MRIICTRGGQLAVRSSSQLMTAVIFDNWVEIEEVREKTLFKLLN